MTGTPQHLVVIDFPGIKRYVFGTDRLVEIRGASALLDNLNRVTIPELISETFGASQSHCVFAGGGAGQFTINAARESILDAFDSIQGQVHSRTGGALRLITGMAPVAGNYPVALASAFLDLEKKKRENPFDARSSIHTGFMRECDSCSGMAAAPKKYASDTRMLCSACARKEQMGRERGLWGSLSVHFERQGIAADKVWEMRPEDFEKIGERCRSRRGYTALVYGDGNAMGRLVKRIATQKQFEQFSAAVDSAIRESCHEALWEHCQPVDGKIPADILLLGGDDLMVYLAADSALPFAITVARLFEEKTRNKLYDGDDDGFFPGYLHGNGLTISIGIAYAKSHTPISIMVDQAEELLKSAKMNGAETAGKEKRTPACIDFHISSRFNQISVADSRRQHLETVSSGGKPIRLYRGPYTIEEAAALQSHAERIKQSGLGGTRLHRLGAAPFKGKANGTIETLTLYGRCRTEEQKLAIWEALSRFECIQVMPWHEDLDRTSTVLVDLADIAEFSRS